MKNSKTNKLIIISFFVISVINFIYRIFIFGDKVSKAIFGIPITFFSFIFVYILPGFIFSRIFNKKNKPNFILYIFLSLIFLPIIYDFCSLILDINLFNFLFLYIFLFIIFSLISKDKNKIDLNKLFNFEKIDKNFFLIILFILIITCTPRIYNLLNKKIIIGDDFKHTAIITSISNSVRRPLNYNFQKSKLTYYFYNYVHPGLLIKFSNNNINLSVAWFFSNLIQNFIILIIISYFLTFYFKNYYSKIFGIFLFTLISGQEFFMMIINYLKNGEIHGHLEWWFRWFNFTKTINFQISSFYSLFLYTPQHLFSSILLIPISMIIFELKESKLKYLLISIILSSSFGYSSIAGLGIFSGLGLYFFLKYAKTKKIFNEREVLINFLILYSSFLIFSIPNIFILIDKSGIIFFKLSRLNFLSYFKESFITKILDFLISIPFQFLIEFCLIVTIFFYLGVKNKIYNNNFCNFWLIFLILFLPVFFISSKDTPANIIISRENNDFGMRFIIPAQISFYILSLISLDKIYKKTIFNRLKIIILIFILFSLLPTFWEFSIRLYKLYKSENIQPIFLKIDGLLPLNSIIYPGDKNSMDVTNYGHRFSVKGIDYFNNEEIVHLETKYYNNKYQFDSISDFCNFINLDPDLSKYNTFYISNNDDVIKIDCLSK